MAYWLVKSEPSVYSIFDLKRDRVTHWNGVRNYQARNFLRTMAVGEELLFYHSSEETVGVAGLARVAKAAYPDPSQFDKKSEYFDDAATKDAPRWFCPDIEFVEQFPSILPINEIRKLRGVEKMELLKRGSRLSVQPVSENEFEKIVSAARRS